MEGLSINWKRIAWQTVALSEILRAEDIERTAQMLDHKIVSKENLNLYERTKKFKNKRIVMQIRNENTKITKTKSFWIIPKDYISKKIEKQIKIVEEDVVTTQ